MANNNHITQTTCRYHTGRSIGRSINIQTVFSTKVIGSSDVGAPAPHCKKWCAVLTQVRQEKPQEKPHVCARATIATHSASKPNIIFYSASMTIWRQNLLQCLRSHFLAFWECCSLSPLFQAVSLCIEYTKNNHTHFYTAITGPFGVIFLARLLSWSTWYHGRSCCGLSIGICKFITLCSIPSAYLKTSVQVASWIHVHWSW